jgi:hypothetical protein
MDQSKLKLDELIEQLFKCYIMSLTDYIPGETQSNLKVYIGWIFGMVNFLKQTQKMTDMGPLHQYDLTLLSFDKSSIICFLHGFKSYQVVECMTIRKVNCYCRVIAHVFTYCPWKMFVIRNVLFFCDRFFCFTFLNKTIVEFMEQNWFYSAIL